jgi:hypothetical protein
MKLLHQEHPLVTTDLQVAATILRDLLVENE